MWTPLQRITIEATGRYILRVGLAAVISCTVGLVVAPALASAQSANDGVKIAQPTATPAAARHRGRVASSATLVHAPARAEAQQDATVRGAAKPDHARPINRTALAHLESSRDATGLASLSMRCLNCEPGPPTCPPRLYNCPEEP
jgi:hypothetical protein